MVAFKLEVVKFAEDNGGNMATHRKCVVSEKCVWDQRKENATSWTTNKTEMANCGYKARQTNIEEYVLTQRAACRGLNTVQVFMFFLNYYYGVVNCDKM